MKILAAITAGRVLRPGTNYTDDVIMEWLSALDQDLALQAGEGVETDDIDITANTGTYNLPVGFTWDAITGFWLNGTRIPKLTGMAFGRSGVSLVGIQLSIYPVPTSSGTLRVSQQTVRTAYTDKINNVLFLPEPYADAYKWFVAARMYLYDRDMDSYNNMTLLYNNKMEGFWLRKAQTGASDGLAVTNLW